MIGRLSNCHPRHRRWLHEEIVSAVKNMDGFGRLSICHPRHRGWLREGIVSAVMEMNGYEKLSNCRSRHRGWFRGGIVSTVTDMNGYGGCLIVIRGTADGCGKKISMPSTAPRSGSRTGRRPPIPQLVLFQGKCSPSHSMSRPCGSDYGNICSALTKET